ncbi:MAG TPA: protein kinase, partial [Kofleriaceae bacterium]
NTFLARVTNDPRPTVRLLDFGLAKLEIEVDRRAERTQSGVVLGTAMYLSPEQARGPDVDGRTDIYALGCIGYELFLGRHPFAGATTVVGIIAAHLHDVPPMPRSIDPSIPPELDGLLFALLAKDPAHRPTLPQLRAVVENLRARMGAAPVRTLPVRAVRAQTVPVAPISPSAPASTPTRPRSIERTTIVGALVVMLVGIIIGAVARRSGAGSDRPAAATTPVVVDAGARSVLTVDPIVLRAETPISDARPIDSAASPPVDAEPTHQRLAPDAREESVRNAVVTAPSGADTKQAEPTVAPNAAGSNSAAIDARPPTTDAPVLLPRESEPTKIDTAVSPPAPAPPKPPTKMKPSASDRDQIFNPFKKK